MALEFDFLEFGSLLVRAAGKGYNNEKRDYAKIAIPQPDGGCVFCILQRKTGKGGMPSFEKALRMFLIVWRDLKVAPYRVLVASIVDASSDYKGSLKMSTKINSPTIPKGWEKMTKAEFQIFLNKKEENA